MQVTDGHLLSCINKGGVTCTVRARARARNSKHSHSRSASARVAGTYSRARVVLAHADSQFFSRASRECLASDTRVPFNLLVDGTVYKLEWP